MALKMRPTGLGAGIDKDRPDFTIYSGVVPTPRPRRSAALPLGGSRRVATEVDSSIFAGGFCFLAAPKRGERPHQRQSEPNFSLRLLVSQLSSSPAFLCKPLEHARHVHREKPVSMDFRRPNIS